MGEEGEERKGKREFSEDEVKEAGGGGVWVVVRGQVYDVTSFVNEHPGGSQVRGSVCEGARCVSV